jgi:hypothetical protein
MSFAEIVWLIFISFAFVAYLMVLFSILGDLFRDQQVSGWVKAVWIVALIVFPLITALIYLIVRGRGMAERQANEARQVREETDAYIREVASQSAPTVTPADQIAQAQKMLTQGVISQPEYDQLKAKALA